MCLLADQTHFNASLTSHLFMYRGKWTVVNTEMLSSLQAMLDSCSPTATSTTLQITMSFPWHENSRYLFIFKSFFSSPCSTVSRLFVLKLCPFHSFRLRMSSSFALQRCQTSLRPRPAPPRRLPPHRPPRRASSAVRARTATAAAAPTLRRSGPTDWQNCRNRFVL